MNASRLIYSGENVSLEQRYLIFAMYIFFIGVFSPNSIKNQAIGYLLAIFAYVFLFLILFWFKRLYMASNKWMTLAIVGLASILSITTILSPTTSSFLRLVVFIPVFLLNFMFIPENVKRTIFYGTLARLTAIITLIGLPAIIIGSFGPIQAYPVISNPPGFPVPLYGLMSVFNNPNTMGALAAYGALAALWEYFSTDDIFSFFILLINVLGVYLSKSRASLLALFAGMTIVGAYRYADRRTLLKVTATGLISAPIMILIKLGIIPGPDPIRSIDFNHRLHLWTAAFQAILDRPLFGWGLGNVPEAMTPYITRSNLIGAGPHSSYIRMFAATGIVGGLLYLHVYLYSLLRRLRTVTSNAEATEYGMVVSVVTIHTFEGISLFGLSLTSVIPAMVLSYAQK